MAENHIKPEDVSLQVAQKVLDFLNTAKSAEEIADAVEIPDERDVGIIVAQHILDRRKELSKFTNLEQVADVRQVGPERFTEIVNTLGGVVMGYIQKEIKRYSYVFLVSKDEGSPYEVVHLYDAVGNAVGHIEFQDDSATLRKSQGNDKSVNTYYRRSMLPHIIDMLRNEEPLYWWWNIDISGKIISVGISTSTEPIGEEEAP